MNSIEIISKITAQSVINFKKCQKENALNNNKNSKKEGENK